MTEHTFSSGHIFYGMLLNWGLSDVFLVVKLELQVLGKKIIQRKCPSHHILSKVSAVNVTHQISLL